jgi:predicted RNA-binding protein with RPS1 domain
VHCSLVMTDAEPIFEDIKAYLLSVDHEKKMKLRLRSSRTAYNEASPGRTRYRLLRSFGTPKEEHFTMLEEALDEVKELWNQLAMG